ncbi:MAG: tetratricopeptide repeat protein, partial [Verrucomicrobiia bacterium]
MALPDYHLGRFGWFLILATFCLHTGVVRSQEGKTAEELYNSALTSYNAGNFAAAEAALSEFLASYGESGQIDDLLPRILPLLAISQIRVEKFDTAAETIDRALELRPPITPQAAEELSFWRGVCHLKADEFDKARGRFEGFAKEYPRSDKRIEALILAGTAFLLEERWTDAADYLKPLEDAVAFPEKGRLIVLRFYAQLQAGRWDEAMQLVNETFPHLDKMVQVSAMQVMALELGNHLLEQERYREAIGCFQRLWTRSRVIGLQQERLEALRARKVAAERRNDQFDQYRTGQLLAKVERELKTFREIEAFDPAVRLRLATAYLEMDRYREAAIVLEGMLTDLPADPIVEGAALTLLKCWAEVERWPRVVENADRFLAKFRRSTQIPIVLFLRGQAEQELGEFAKAVATFEEIVNKHGDSELAPRALFMMGYTELLNEAYPAAAEIFQKVVDRHPKEDIAEASV